MADRERSRAALARFDPLDRIRAHEKWSPAGAAGLRTRLLPAQSLRSLVKEDLDAAPLDMAKAVAEVVLLLHSDRAPPRERLARGDVFEAFYTTKTNGLGMGLSISRSIVEAHRGRLWAENNRRRGATFCFTVPLAPQ